MPVSRSYTTRFPSLPLPVATRPTRAVASSPSSRSHERRVAEAYARGTPREGRDRPSWGEQGHHRGAVPQRRRYRRPQGDSARRGGRHQAPDLVAPRELTVVIALD